MRLLTHKHRAVGWCAVNLLSLQSQNLFHLCLSCSLWNNVYKNKIGSKNIEYNKLWLHCVPSWGMSWPKSLQYFYLGLCFVFSHKVFHLLTGRNSLDSRDWLNRATVAWLSVPAWHPNFSSEATAALFVMDRQRESPKGDCPGGTYWPVSITAAISLVQPHHHISTTVTTTNPDSIIHGHPSWMQHTYHLSGIGWGLGQRETWEINMTEIWDLEISREGLPRESSS